MRAVPDWTIQVAWWASGIFATGAAWYFLSTDKLTLAVISGFTALLLAGFAIYLHRCKDALAATLIPDELKEDLPDEFVRRTVHDEAHLRVVIALPELKSAVRHSLRAGWASPRTLDMREANYDMIDFLQFAWLRLAEFYPRKHFDGKDAQAYIEGHIRARFAFHWAKHEPSGPGSGGTVVGVLTGADVIQDLDTLARGTMQSLFFDNEFLDLDDWLQRWEAASSDARTCLTEVP